MTDEKYKPPTTRMEAVAEIITTGGTISALLAVAAAFPLPGETEETNAMLARLREHDPQWHDDLIRERDKYLASWGKEPPR